MIHLKKSHQSNRVLFKQFWSIIWLKIFRYLAFLRDNFPIFSANVTCIIYILAFCKFLCEIFFIFLLLAFTLASYTIKNVITLYFLMRYFSTKAIIKLNPWYVTGFSDGESCFNIWLAKSKSTSTGWQVQARFIIEVHIKDISLLEKIQYFFGGIGSITTSKKKARFAVQSLKEILIILTHFENYPLQTSKDSDFYFWKKCINLMLDKQHLTIKGLEKIVSYKLAMNTGVFKNLNFPGISAAIKPILNKEILPLNPYWVTGFIDAEGSFFFNHKNNLSKLSPGMNIGLNIKDVFILERINKFFFLSW